MRLFDPDIRLSAIAPKRPRSVQRDQRFTPSERARQVLDTLSRASEPMMARIIARAILVTKGLDGNGQTREIIEKWMGRYLWGRAAKQAGRECREGGAGRSLASAVVK